MNMTFSVYQEKPADETSEDRCVATFTYAAGAPPQSEKADAAGDEVEITIKISFHWLALRH